jgi:hypothetical protein
MRSPPSLHLNGPRGLVTPAQRDVFFSGRRLCEEQGAERSCSVVPIFVWRSRTTSADFP